ncbi:hypothetical protein ACI65C_011429 [Semiaphis heraclei]
MSDLSSSEEDVRIIELGIISRNYVIVEFIDGVQLVPRNWISSNQKETFYPEDINSKQYDKMVLNTVPHGSTWKTFSIKKIWGSSDNFIRAKQKLKIALQLSEAEDLNSEIDEVLAKKNAESLLIKGFSIPPLPKDPFKSLPVVTTQKRKICKLQSNKLKHSPKAKHCNKLDEVSIADHKNVGKNTRYSKYCSKNSVHSPSTSKQDWSVNRTCIEENTEVYKLPNQNKNIDNYPSTSTQYSFPNHKNDLYINQLKLYSPISKIDVTKNNGIPTLSNENDLMASPPMFMDSPIKSGLKRSFFDKTPESTKKYVKMLQ